MVLYSELCVAKGITNIESKDVYAGDLTKKKCYWKKEVPGEIIDSIFQDKEVDGVDMLETIT